MVHDQEDDLRDLLLGLMPSDGTPIGNVTLLRELGGEAKKLGISISEEQYRHLRDGLIEEGTLRKGLGRGGSVRLLRSEERKNALKELLLGLVPKNGDRIPNGKLLSEFKEGWVRFRAIRALVHGYPPPGDTPASIPNVLSSDLT